MKEVSELLQLDMVKATFAAKGGTTNHWDEGAGTSSPGRFGTSSVTNYWVVFQ